MNKNSIKASYFVFLVSLILIPPSWSPAGTRSTQNEVLYRAYLPQVSAVYNFNHIPAIWAYAGSPPASEVAFFRYVFTTQQDYDEARLEIFADTRYEVWLDGKKLGRGPARFLAHWREVDHYSMDGLPAGDHLIAVLVQWAPNARRAESTSPLLQARMSGFAAAGAELLAETGTDWLCQISNAWRNDSAPIAQSGLIGPSELLDFRLLDPGWNLPGPISGAWQPAVVVDANPAFSTLALVYQPRSIAAPADVPVSASVFESGNLSPGYSLGEIPAGSPVPYDLSFNISEPLDFSIEILSASLPASNLVLINLSSLSWSAAGSQRPDVYTSTVRLYPGWQQLRFNQIPEWGMTFSVSLPVANFASFPFSQSLHAGKRTLLAQNITNPGSVVAVPGSQGLQIEFLTTPAYLVLDLGRTIHGRLVAEIEGPAGTVVDIGWDERLQDGHRPLPYPGSLYTGWNQVDSWILDGTTRSLSTLDARAGRYVLIDVWCPESECVPSEPGSFSQSVPVRITNLQVLEETSLLSQAGDFSSSDPQLDRIWQVGVDSLIPNLSDSYTDTPWRERGHWLGDAYVQEHIFRLVSASDEIMRRELRMVAQAMQIDPAPGMVPHNDGLHMLDYSMLWLHSLAEYVHLSGDTALAAELYPTVKRLMQHLAAYESAQTGLLDLPKLHWTQTAYIDSWCIDCRYGQSTALNSIYYGTLTYASTLAARLNDAAAAATWQAKAQIVKTNIHAVLFRPAEGRYSTTLYNGVFIPATPHSQAWPLAYGITPPSEISRVTDSLMALLSTDPTQPNLQPYGMFWLLEALGKNGYTDLGLDVIRRYYGYLLDAGATTWWERFDALPYRSSSLSHAWGGAPTWFLTTYVLGLQRSSPESYLLTPSFSGLQTAAGTLPLAVGTVEASWERSACGGYLLNVNAPVNTRGTLVLPAPGAGDTLVMDERVIWTNGQPVTNQVAQYQETISFQLTSGAHRFSLAAACP